MEKFRKKIFSYVKKIVFVFVLFSSSVFLGILLFFFARISQSQGETFYYNAAEDNDWSNLDNWWADAGFTTQILNIPDEGDNVVISGNINSNNGQTISVNSMVLTGVSVLGVDAIVAEEAIFNEESHNAGVVTGSSVFNDSSWNENTVNDNVIFNGASYNIGSISGDVIFNDSSSNYTVGAIDPQSGTIYGNAVFNNNSYNIGVVTGDAVFNDLSNNYRMGNNYGMPILVGSISGDVIFNDSSYNQGLVSGNASFYDSSDNKADGSVDGDACFSSTATNNGDVGGVVTVCSASLPVVVTIDSVLNLNSKASILSGSIIDTGGEVIKTVGFQYGIDTDYGSTVSKIGLFNNEIFGAVAASLLCDTTYHFRAFVTNSAGSGYGNDVAFTTDPCSSSVSILYGVDGSIYNEDEPVLYTINPATGKKVSSIGPVGFYVTGLAFDPVSGVLYGSTSDSKLITISTSTGVGVSVNSITDNNDMLVMSDIAFSSDGELYGWVGENSALYSIDFTSCQGAKVSCLATKIGNTVASGLYDNSDISLAFDSEDRLFLFNNGDNNFYEINPDTGAVVDEFLFTNSSGHNFTITSAKFGKQDKTIFATRLNYGEMPADFIVIDFNTNSIISTGENNADIQYMNAIAFSPEIITNAPTVSTYPASEITSQNTATLNGEIIDTGGLEITVRGFDYGETQSYGLVVAEPNGSYSSGAFSANISSLICNTTYHFRAYAVNAKGTSYGNDTIFVSDDCPVLVEEVIEEKENLNTGPSLDEILFPEPPITVPLLENISSEEVILTPQNNTENNGSLELTTEVSEVVEAILVPTRVITNNPAVKTFGNVAPAVPVTTSLFVLAASFASGVSFVNYFFYLLVILSQFLGFKRKPKPWGTVYDSVTKRPLPFARVEILNEQARKLESTIADGNGRYGFLVSEQLTNIEIRAFQSKYTFPSNAEPTIVEQKLYPNIYRGGIINASSGLTNFDLPMDPINKTTAQNFYFGISSIRINNFLAGTANILFLLGAIFGVVNTMVNHNAVSIVILIFILLTFVLRTSGFKLKPFGLTRDIETKQTLPFGLVALHNKDGDRLSFTVSDNVGRYFLLVPKGNYLLKAYTPSHITPTRTKELSISTRKGWISKEIEI